MTIERTNLSQAMRETKLQLSLDEATNTVWIITNERKPRRIAQVNANDLFDKNGNRFNID